jgi:hypothetical protein
VVYLLLFELVFKSLAKAQLPTHSAVVLLGLVNIFAGMSLLVIFVEIKPSLSKHTELWLCW